MPDFCMCTDDECPVRDLCRRHPESGTIPAGPNGAWQAYADFRHTDIHGCRRRVALDAVELPSGAPAGPRFK